MLLSAGCQELRHHCAAVESCFGPPLPPYPTCEIVNAGYCETNWNTLAPTAGSHLHLDHHDQVEPYAEMEEIPAIDGQSDFPSTQPIARREASSYQPGGPELVPARLEILGSGGSLGGNKTALFVDDVQDTLDFARP